MEANHTTALLPHQNGIDHPFGSTMVGKDRQASGDARNNLPWPIEMVRPGTLKPAQRNARSHSKKQIKQLADSIIRYGFIIPVIVDDDGRIVCGHARVEAAKLLGLGHAPVIRINHLSPAEARAFAIADNQLATKAGWDREALVLELGELAELLPAEGLDISWTGFETPEIDQLLLDMASSKMEPEDMLPTVPRSPATRRGDLWQLGKQHRLSCGDARDPKTFARLMGNVRAAAGICDPPYNLPARSIGGRGRTKHAEFAFASGEMTRTEFRQFLEQTLGNAAQFSAKGAVHYNFIDWRHVADLIDVGHEIYDAMLNLIVWNKSNAGQGSFYRSQHELIGVFRVGKQPHRNNIELGRFGRNRSNVWTYQGVNTFGRGRMEALSSHPTVKPVALVADALLDCTARGDVVLDQFAGSGTIFLAAEKVGRRGFGIEFEPRFVDVAIQRWQQSTKQEATLAGDGRTFGEIRALRSGEDSKPNAPQSADPTSRADRSSKRT